MLRFCCFVFISRNLMLLTLTHIFHINKFKPIKTLLVKYNSYNACHPPPKKEKRPSYPTPNIENIIVGILQAMTPLPTPCTMVGWRMSSSNEYIYSSFHLNMFSSKCEVLYPIWPMYIQIDIPCIYTFSHDNTQT